MEANGSQEDTQIPADILFCFETLLFLELFPAANELDRDTLLQLFLAAGLHQEESTAVACLDSLESLGYITCSKEADEQTGKQWYKVNIGKVVDRPALDVGDPADNYVLTCTSTRKVTSELHLLVDFDDPNDRRLLTTRATLQHVTVQNLPTSNFQQLERFLHLKTLWFLRSHKSRIQQVPYQFFISLKLLRVLNLSRTRISELPNSIRHLRGLIYLDLSYSLLKNLPRSIANLQGLKTLKLQNCRDLVTLPKNTFNLTKLQHLDLGSLCTLNSMPPRLGELTQLRRLSAFLVGHEPRCGISEVSNLNHLQGELCLSRLENVPNSIDATAANLSDKSMLRSLTLQWSQRQRSDSLIADEVIESLQPSTNLKYLQLLGYGGSRFPTWIADPSFIDLVNINLSLSENCKVLPPLGRLPSLKSLTLDALTGIRVIDYHICRENYENDDVAFPKLQNLALVSLRSLEEWKDVSKSDFPSLVKLEIKGCSKLVTVCSLSNMLSLQHLQISQCPLFPSLPADGVLPTSVQEVVIEECPLLESSCSSDGKDWHKIKHVRSVWIDYEEISST